MHDDGTHDFLKLRELPELTPPPGVWERVLAAEQARRDAWRFRRRASALAATVALTVIAVSYVVNVRSTAEAEASYAALVAESARLERVLAELPAARPLMVGSTAGTIAGLEDRIAFVDAQLSYAAARDVAPLDRRALWGERIELMNALVFVRYAQAQ
jgi:hypothetical protein